MSSTLRFLPVALALLLIASPAPAQVVIHLDFDEHEDLAYPPGSRRFRSAMTSSERDGLLAGPVEDRLASLPSA